MVETTFSSKILLNPILSKFPIINLIINPFCSLILLHYIYSMKEEINKLRVEDPNYRIITKSISFSQKQYPEKFLYYYKVWSITNTNLHHVENISQRGKHYHLDHIIPIHIGYKYDICPSIIGSSANLRILEGVKNMRKSCTITDDTIKVLKDFGIDLSVLEPKKIVKYTPVNVPKCFDDVVIPEKGINISTTNKSSLLYYLPENKGNKLKVYPEDIF